MLAREADVMLVLGSQNSSNSQRLAELAARAGVPAHLIDGAADIDPDWFRGHETVLITAGASARNRSSKSASALLREKFAATVEARTIREEEVYFPLPKSAARSGEIAARGRWRVWPRARGERGAANGQPHRA